MIAAGTVVCVAALLGGGAVWLRRRYLGVTVDGDSMTPTYLHGSRLLVRRTTADAVRRGDVLVFAGFPPVLDGRENWVVKRVAAVPGDPVPRDTVPALRDVPGESVPPGHLVVLGDRPDHSYDSRRFGYLAAGRVMGVVVRSLAHRDPVV